MRSTEGTAPRDPAGGVAATRRHRLRAFGALLALVAVVVLLRWLVVTVHVVESGSMAPTAEPGDVVVVDRLSPRWSPIERGELVVVDGPQGRLLKRVVGVGGDSVVIRDALLYVNGEAVTEPYVDHASIDGLFTALTVVPDGYLYLLGDRRDGSIDSRDFGPVPLDSLEGRAALIL